MKKPIANLSWLQEHHYVHERSWSVKKVKCDFVNFGLKGVLQNNPTKKHFYVRLLNINYAMCNMKFRNLKTFFYHFYTSLLSTSGVYNIISTFSLEIWPVL